MNELLPPEIVGTLGSFSQVVLLSHSPQRQKLLSFLHPRLDSLEIDERPIQEQTLEQSRREHPGESVIFQAARIVRALAQAKAGLSDPTFFPDPDTLYISADTLVVAHDNPVGKPSNLAEAEAMLRGYFGTTHTVVSGACLRTISGYVSLETRADITFAPYSPLMEKPLTDYLTPILLTRAGGYGLQDLPPAFLERINGDPNTIIGLSVSSLLPYLHPELSDFGFPSIDVFTDLTQQVVEELPAYLFQHLNGMIQIEARKESHPKAQGDELLVLGRYVQSRLMGRHIELYYGSFQALFPYLRGVGLKKKIQDVLTHEFRHHVESLAGNRELEMEDEAFLQEFFQNHPEA